MYRICCVLTFILLAACSREQMLQKFSTPQDQAEAKHYVELLRTRQFGEFRKVTNTAIPRENLFAELDAMAKRIPEGEPKSIKLVGAVRSTDNGETSVRTTLEYEFDGGWMLAVVKIEDPEGARRLIGFNIVPEKQSLEQANRFDFRGKGFAQYFVFCAAILGVTITVWALVLCARTRNLHRKWLWVLFILCGFCELAVNWSTGDWSFSPAAVQLFSASFVAPFYGAVTISTSLPLGAILFLWRRRRGSLTHVEATPST
ncbi:MAG TPA: hypothetical protein VFB32_06615 [Rudaea sp.]|nr:hypothetical protein [Rudaea sp.]